MKLIPSVKEQKQGVKTEITGCTFIFPENCDKRVINLAKKVPEGDKIVKINVTGCKGENYKITFKDEITVDINGFSPHLVSVLKKDLNLKEIKLVDESIYSLIEFKSSKMKEEAYILDVKNEKIRIEASSDKGIYYAIKTLKQIKNKQTIDCVLIEDSPDLLVRGAMIDISRSKVPKLKTLKEIVDLLSDLKYNHLELYVEGFSYEYASFPELLVDKNYITLNDYLELEKYANEHYIDLVPNQNGFGHMTDWLSKEKYK